MAAAAVGGPRQAPPRGATARAVACISARGGGSLAGSCRRHRGPPPRRHVPRRGPDGWAGRRLSRRRRLALHRAPCVACFHCGTPRRRRARLARPLPPAIAAGSACMSAKEGVPVVVGHCGSSCGGTHPDATRPGASVPGGRPTGHGWVPASVSGPPAGTAASDRAVAGPGTSAASRRSWRR